MMESRFSRVLTVFPVLILLTVPPHSEAGSRVRAPKKVSHPAAKGKRSAPMPKPYQVGRATWYGDRFHGRVTASGEQFDMFHLTAAHRKLPLGTHVRVTPLGTNRSVVVRITDRGPNRGTAVIDLSYAAAKQLRLVRSGSRLVRLDLERSETARFSPVGEIRGEPGALRSRFER